MPALRLRGRVGRERLDRRGGRGGLRGQVERRRVAHRDEQAELGLIVAEHGIHQGLACLVEQVEVVEDFQRRSGGGDDTLEVFPVSLLGGLELLDRDPDLLALRQGIGPCRTDLLSDQVDHPVAIGHGDSHLSLPPLHVGEVARPEVQQRPVSDGVEVGPAPELADERGNQVAPAAEGPAAEAEPDGREERASLLLTGPGLGGVDQGGPGPDLRSNLPCDLEQVLEPGVGLDQREDLNRPARRLDPGGRVEVEASGEPGGRDGEPFLRPADLSLSESMLGLGAVGVGLATLAGPGIGGGDPGDLGRLDLGPPAGLQEGAGGLKVQVLDGDAEEDRVGRRRGVEPGGIDPLAGGERLEKRISQVGGDVDRRHVYRPRGRNARPAAEIDRLAVDAEDLPGGTLEEAGVGVVVSACVEVRQEHDPGLLLVGHRFVDPGPRLTDDGIDRLGQPDGRGQVDRIGRLGRERRPSQGTDWCRQALRRGPGDGGVG